MRVFRRRQQHTAEAAAEATPETPPSSSPKEEASETADPNEPNPVEDDVREQPTKEEIAQAKMKIMKLNEAFESLDAMQKANLELEFDKTNIDKSLLGKYCTECLREEAHLPPRPNGPFRRFRNRRHASPCCMVCATPVCEKHACKGYDLHFCEGQCKPLLSPEGLIEHLDSLENDEERLRFVQHIMETYDRSLLLLKYATSCEDLNELADSLENSTRNNTKIRLSGSGMGFMAGVTGVTAMAAPVATAAHITAAATLAAVSPPLLLASLVLGCTGAATQLGHELAIHKFYKSSEVQVRYHKLLAWTNVVKTVAIAAENLRDRIEASKVTAIVVYQPQTNLFEEALRQAADGNTAKESLRETEGTECLTEASSLIGGSSEKTQVEEEEAKVVEDAFEDAVEEMPLLEPDTEDYSEETEETKEDNENKNDLCDDAEIPRPETVDPEDEVLDKPLISESSENSENSDNSEQERMDGSSGLQTNKKHPLSFLVPLFPMADDVALTTSQVLANPHAGARLALAHAAKVAQYASVACGALSALTIAFEGNNIKRNLKVLETGCEKAQRVRSLDDDVRQIPHTNEIAQTYHEYLQIRAAV